MAGTGQGYCKAATFAGVIQGDARLRKSRAVIPRPGEGEPGANVFVAARCGRHPIALVEPGRKQRAVRVEGERLEALALGVGGDRSGCGKTAPAVGRARIEDLSVEFLILETSEGDKQAAVVVDDDIRSRIGSPIDVERLRVDRNGCRERMAEIRRVGHRNRPVRSPGNPERSVCCEGRGDLRRAGETRVGAFRIAFGVVVMRHFRQRRAGGTKRTAGDHDQENMTTKRSFGGCDHPDKKFLHRHGPTRHVT